MSEFKKGEKVFVRDYKCHPNGECVQILRPAEVAGYQQSQALLQVFYLDVPFRKGGRNPYSEPVLKSKVIHKHEKET